MDELARYLIGNSAGDVGVWVLVYIAWKLDKRITILEVKGET